MVPVCTRCALQSPEPAAKRCARCGGRLRPPARDRRRTASTALWNANGVLSGTIEEAEPGTRQRAGPPRPSRVITSTDLPVPQARGPRRRPPARNLGGRRSREGSSFASFTGLTALGFVGLVALATVALITPGLWGPGDGALSPRSTLSPMTALRDPAAALAEDSPEGYTQAAAHCEAVGDPLCQAEALLLLDLRYGPDPIHRATAQRLLEGSPAELAASAEGHRISNLLALTACARRPPGAAAALPEDSPGVDPRATPCGDPEAASSSPASRDDPQAELYRGWLAQARGDLEGAAAIARDLGPATPAAALLAIDSDPEATVDDYRRLVARHPTHPRSIDALVTVLIADGALEEAASWLRRWRPSERASPDFRARPLLHEATLQEAQGFPSEALALYDRAAALAPGCRELFLRRARLLLRTGDLTRLRSELQALDRADSDRTEPRNLADDPEIAALRLELERELQASLPRLTAVTSSAAAASPLAFAFAASDRGGPWGPYLVAWEHHLQGDRAAALGELRAARELDPDFVPGILREAELLFDLGRDREAFELLAGERQRLRRRLARRPLLAAEVDALLREDRRRDALLILDQALAEDPDDNLARIQRGILRLEIGREQAGRDDLFQIKARAGVLTELIEPLGRLYLREGAVDRAAALITPRVDDPRADPCIILLAGEIALGGGDLGRAQELAERLLLLPKIPWRAHLLVGEVAIARGDLAEATAALAAVQPPRPLAELELLRGRLLEAQGEPAAALLRYRQAHRLDPHSPTIALHLARTQVEVDALGPAIALLEPLVAGPAPPPAGAPILLARALADNHARDRALAVLDRHLADHPGDAEALYWRGRILDERRRADQATTDPGALEALERAVEAAPSAPTPTPWLVDALDRLIAGLEALGDEDRAEPYRQRRRELTADTAHPPA